MGLEGRVTPLLEGEARQLNAAQRRQVIATWTQATMQEPIMVVFLALGLYFALTRLDVPLSGLLVLAILFNRSVPRVGLLQKHLQNIAASESAFWSLRRAIDAAEKDRERSGGASPPAPRGCSEK